MHTSREKSSSWIRVSAMLALVTSLAFGQCPADWSPTGFCNTLDGQVNCATVYDDGTGPKLYVGGTFTTVGGAAAANVAVWDGTTWGAVGAGIAGGSVLSLCVHDDGTGSKLYACGWFNTPAGYVARWDGISWTAVGAGFNNGATILASYDDGNGSKLYCGGNFSVAGDNSVLLKYLARWDGVSWSQIGPGANQAVSGLGVFNGSLYVGGSFTAIGGIAAARFARYNGGGFSVVGSGTVGIVNNMVVWDDGTGPALYCTGTFNSGNGVACAKVGKFDGTNWSPLGSGLAGTGVFYGGSLAVYDDGTGAQLYCVGQFSSAGGVAANRIARWNGTTWSAVAGGIDNYGLALCVYNNALYCGGGFANVTGVGGSPVAIPNLAKWGPTAPYIVTQPATQTVNLGTPVTFSVVAGGIGNSYQWRRYGGPITGATNPSFTISSPGPLDWGAYDCVVTNGCAGVLSAPAFLYLNPGFNMLFDQPFGSQSLRVAHASPTQPGTQYLTTFSFDPLNSTNPGDGPWMGMWVAYNDIVAQFLNGFAPFYGVLDAQGSALFLVPAGVLPPFLIGQTVTAVSLTFTPALVPLLHSNYATINLF